MIDPREVEKTPPAGDEAAEQDEEPVEVVDANGDPATPELGEEPPVHVRATPPPGWGEYPVEEIDPALLAERREQLRAFFTQAGDAQDHVDDHPPLEQSEPPPLPPMEVLRKVLTSPVEQVGPPSPDFGPMALVNGRFVPRVILDLQKAGWLNGGPP